MYIKPCSLLLFLVATSVLCRKQGMERYRFKKWKEMVKLRIEELERKIARCVSAQTSHGDISSWQFEERNILGSCKGLKRWVHYEIEKHLNVSGTRSFLYYELKVDFGR